METKKTDKYDGEQVEWPDYLAHFETISKWNGWAERPTASYQS